MSDNYSMPFRSAPIQNTWNAPVYSLECCNSTMQEMRHLEREGAVHGTVVTTDFQSEGRGRTSNRRWWTGEAEKNLAFTLLLRYASISAIPQAITLRCGLAIALAIAKFAPQLDNRIAVKWPNDIMIGKKKVCGILSESDGRNVYTGIGINVLQQQFDGLPSATSIINEAPDISRDTKIRFELLEIILRYLHTELEGAADWTERLNQRLFMKGSNVTFLSGSADNPETVRGTLYGVARTGELLLQREGRTTPEMFITGELSSFY